jgi:tetratricopeptide (TPR) repeat protein
MPSLIISLVCGVKIQPAPFWAKLPYFVTFVFLLAMGCAEGGGYYAPGDQTDAQKNLMNKPPTSKNEIMQKTPQMSRDEARQIIFDEISECRGEVTNAGFSYITIGTRKQFKFSEIKDIHLDPFRSGYVTLVIDGNGLFYTKNGERVAKAISAMVYYASVAPSDPAALKAFTEKAKAWRALAVKPPLPEQVNRYRAQAEDAFQNKEFDKAADCYEKALDIYPVWPQGQFNAALIYGELGVYHQAINHMQRYLELVPDAKDAKAAREKIYVWEGKVEK